MKKILLAFFLLPLSLMAQKNYPQLMDDYMEAQASVKEFSGTVLIMQKDKVIYEKAFGMADREWNVPNTINTKYRIGSVTKQFTAACIMQLEEQGKLSLTDKLSKYIPDYPKGDSVTIHMLLNHTSGITNYTALPSFGAKATLPLSPDSLIAIFKNAPYDFSPGTKWKYSNSGYILLGYIIEKVSGITYSNYLLKNIVQKIGLKNTSLDRVDSILQYRAKGYEKDGGVWRNAMFISMEVPFSAGAMVSTVHDLQKWMQALMEDKVVSAASVQKMTMPYKNHYGYGLVIDSLGTHKYIGHGGAIPGFLSYLVYFPADDVYVVAISNDLINAQPIAEGLASIFFNQSVLVPSTNKEIKLSAAELQKFIGTYEIQKGVDIKITLDNDQLFAQLTGQSAFAIFAKSATEFFFKVVDAQLQFAKNDTGNISSVMLLQNGRKTEAKRIK